MGNSRELEELVLRLEHYINEAEKANLYKTGELGGREFSLPSHNIMMVKKMVLQGLISNQFRLSELLDLLYDAEMIIKGHLVDIIGYIMGDPEVMRVQKIKQPSSKDLELFNEIERISLVPVLLDLYADTVLQYQTNVEEFIKKCKTLEGTPFASETYVRNKILPRITKFSPESFRDVSGDEIPRILSPLWKNTAHLFHFLDRTKEAVIRLYESIGILFPEKVNEYLEILEDRSANRLLRQILARVIGNVADKSVIPVLEGIKQSESDDTLKQSVKKSIKKIRTRNSFFYKIFYSS